MHPRALGPYALQMQRLTVLIAVLAAVSISIVSGPQLIPTWSSPTDVAQWLVYSPNLIVPTCAGMCALAATITTVRTRRHTPTLADTGWFLLTRVYLVCYLALMIACVAMPAVKLASPIPPVYYQAVVSDTSPILALNLPAAICCIAVLRGRHTAVYLSIIALLQIMALIPANPTNTVFETAVGPLYFLLVAMTHTGMLEWTLTTVRGLDQSRRSARDAERALSVERARGRARARSNGLIHDYVLSALILAFKPGIARSDARAGADAALRALVPDPPSDATMDAAQLRGVFETLVAPGQPHWSVTLDLPSGEWRIPGDVGRALSAATHEALNNVRVHAGSDASNPCKPAQCRVEVVGRRDCVRVTITDTGCGFDVSRGTEGRHGVSQSIVERMRAIGGSATLASHPGDGTRVTLEWCAPRRHVTSRQVVRSAIAWRPRVGQGDKDPSRTQWDLKVRGAAESRGARLLVVVGVAFHTYMVAIEFSHGAYTHAVPVILALALMAVSGGALVASWPGRVVPKPVAWGSAAAVGLINVAVLVMIRNTSGWPGWSSWSAGASMLLLALLLIRQCTLEAVVGFAGLEAAVVAWVVIQGRPPFLIVSFSIGHVLTFIFWFALVRWSGIATSAIKRSLKAESRARLDKELHVSANRAMAVKLADVSVRVRGTLEAIRDQELTPELSMKALLLEAELRDEIRAPYFTGTEVVAAARRARSRGVEVVLFDDRGDASRSGSTEYEERLRTRIVERAVAALDEAGAGRVVVRACPAGRPWAATILTDAGLAVVEAKEDAVEVGEAVD